MSKMYAVIRISWSMAAMLCDVFVVFRIVHALVIQAASHVDHEKRVAWFSIFMHTRGSLPIVMVFRRAAGAPL